MSEKISPFFDDVNRCDAIVDGFDLNVMLWMGLEELVRRKIAEPLQECCGVHDAGGDECLDG